MKNKDWKMNSMKKNFQKKINCFYNKRKKRNQPINSSKEDIRINMIIFKQRGKLLTNMNKKRQINLKKNKKKLMIN